MTDGGASVLERFLADVSVDEYGDVEPSSSPAGPARRRPAWAAAAALAGATAGLVLVAALVATTLSTSDRAGTRAALEERVTALTASVAAQQEAVDRSRVAVADLQAELLAATDADPARAAAAARLAQVTGVAAAAGPGVVVTLADAPDAAPGSLNQVLDRDLQDVVNALWQEGATGIAVNGERITAATAIRSAGEAILVDYRPLSPPYVVSALGAAAADAAESGTRGLLAQLTRDYGLVTDLRAGDVALPAGEPRAIRHAAIGGGASGP